MQTLDPKNFRGVIDDHFEWLACYGSERPFPIRSDEIELENKGSHFLFGFISNKGFRSFRVRSFENDLDGVKLELSGAFGIKHEIMRLTPRVSAAALNTEIELAKLRRAERLAAAFTDVAFTKIESISASGRVAKITLGGRSNKKRVVIYDLSGLMNHESLLAAAISKCSDTENCIKSNIGEICIAAKKKTAGELRKLLSLIKPSVASTISIYEATEHEGENSFSIKRVQPMSVSRLWRMTAKGRKAPYFHTPSDLALKIQADFPQEIDVLFERKGETLRFNGLPFARIREIGGSRDIWLGTGVKQKRLTEDDHSSLTGLLTDLQHYRTYGSGSLHHELFRRSPEAWLEFMLRKNITKLDPNLILSPVHQQFGAAGDRVDLLALREDGRLVIIEVKMSPDKETVFQVADYWTKIEQQRRTGMLERSDLFNGRKIADMPALVYVVAPALSFHNSFEDFSRMLLPEIELWKWELHRKWRDEIKVLSRRTYAD